MKYPITIGGFDGSSTIDHILNVNTGGIIIAGSTSDS
jgi:hypothetical protein